MKTIRILSSLCIIAVTRGVGAQTEDYLPAQRLREGRELVVLYIGSTDCAPCHSPAVKSAVRAMKPLLAAQAKQQSAAFSVIGVAQDWDLKRGIAFLEPLGAFDQIAIGGNWTNLAVEQFVLRDSLAAMAMPQVIVLERTVELGARVKVSEPRVLRRITGGTDIPAWVAAGAPIAREDRKPF
jgi:hypothetical protein